MFSSYATAAATFPPLEDPNPRWHPDTMALPSCPCASIYPQMLQLRTGVCLPKNGKTYWTGTIIQTNEITEQFCPYKSASACWQYDASYRANSPLDPCLYRVFNTTYHLLNDTNPQLARDCWLCLSLGTPRYLATPVPLNIATAMGTPTDPPLPGPVLRAMELAPKVPECFTNDGGIEPVGSLATDQCNHG